MEEKIGLKFPSYSYNIERGKVKEFALAIGDDNPLYLDEKYAKKAGYRDIPIQPTFPTVMEFWAGPNIMEIAKELALDPLKLLHGEQQYTFYQDICAGDELTGEMTVTDIQYKKNLTLVTIETDFCNELGEKVLHSRMLLIEKR